MLGRLDGIPVLMYHGVGDLMASIDAGEARFWVTAAGLRQHLEQIRYAGFRTARLSEYWGAVASASPERSLVITFDDGRASDYTAALPLLVETGARAEFFVNTGTIGTRGYLDWAQIREMQRMGMSFQSHAHDHVALPTLSPIALAWQLRRSKAILEDRLGAAVDYLAAPYGLLSGRVIAVAADVGYRAVCNSWHWPARRGGRVINRVAVMGNTTAEQFAGLLTRAPGAYLPGFGRMALVELPKRMMLKLRPHRLGVALATDRP
jgi:peptidoglycan/xylan/chitin deacetylase (PgdA/CDA1 family)